MDCGFPSSVSQQELEQAVCVCRRHGCFSICSFALAGDDDKLTVTYRCMYLRTAPWAAGCCACESAREAGREGSLHATRCQAARPLSERGRGRGGEGEGEKTVQLVAAKRSARGVRKKALLSLTLARLCDIT